ncbi:hypothetical protein [Leyella stercorea]
MNFLCFQHPHLPSRASASTAASIRADRYEYPHRPPRTISIRLQK